MAVRRRDRGGRARALDPVDYPAIAAGVEAHGLIARGGFHPRAADRVPALPGGRGASTLVLVGNAGPAMWRAFSRAREFATEPDPLNRWSARVLGDLARRWGARAVFPFAGPPHLPFVAWAKRAEPVAESPLGMLIHPDHGLWHAYRGALAFAEAIDLPPREERPRPCDTCLEKPCLSACPVGAFANGGYDVGSCADHIAGSAGADCLDEGCRARRACPVGRPAVYQPAQAGLHMRAFLGRQRREGRSP